MGKGLFGVIDNYMKNYNKEAKRIDREIKRIDDAIKKEEDIQRTVNERLNKISSRKEGL